MADKLTEAFDAWVAAHDDTPQEPFAIFQGGFTAAAGSMRERAQKLAQGQASRVSDKDRDLMNDLINAIGSLPDIPA
jgi:hypothetical protein